MGYYVSGGGTVDFRPDITEDDFKRIEEILEGSSIENSYSHSGVDLYQYEKYYEDEWLNLLDNLSPFVIDGEINFAGANEYYWRFVFRDGKFVDESGAIVYEEEDKQNARIRSALKTFITREENNLSLDSLYLLVKDAGLTKEDMKLLKLDYLIPLDAQ